MLKIFRAFTWMRWRVLINSLERTSARDTLERFSLAIEQIGPIIAAVLLIPSTLMLAALGAYSGYAMATGSTHALTFEALRYIVLAATVVSAIGPVLMPAGHRLNAVRLLLLPIPRRTLYVAQTAVTLSDPWTILVVPVILSVAAGLAVGGALAAAAASLLSGALLLVVMAGLSSCTTNVVQLLVRDRKRGELLALLFILMIPAASVLPGLLEAQQGRESGREERRFSHEFDAPAWVDDLGRRAFSLAPSELYAAGIRSGARGQASTVGASFAALAGAAVILHALAFAAFGRVLDSPSTTASRRVATGARAWSATLPGLSRGASAVALAQIRLALRTPRGRSILLSPLLVFLMFAVILRRTGGMTLGAITLQSGVGLAAFGSFVCMLSILPVAMNQFAIDRAGLTLALLSPLETAELLTGKAVGNAVIAGTPALICVLVALALFPRGPAYLWLSIPPALIATYLLVAPAAAALSAIFPRAVDLNSIGSGSNAHGAAGVLGMMCFVAAGLPAAALTFTATTVIDRPGLAPALLVVWCAAAFILSRLFFLPVRRLFEKRRENLGMIVS